MLHSKQLRSIKMLLDSNHGIYRDLSGLTASSRIRKEQPMSDEKPMGLVIQIDEARIRDRPPPPSSVTRLRITACAGAARHLGVGGQFGLVLRATLSNQQFEP
jgi:hypothetical protein